MNNEKIIVTAEMLDELRNIVSTMMDERRFSHTLGVEREAEALGKLFLPFEVMRLRAAALLHDITKQYKTEKQLKICEEFGIIISDGLRASPKLFHALTGSLVAKRDLSEYADEEMIGAVRWHTTGRAGMTLFESLIYLADYIEDTRTFEDCIILRKLFYMNIEKARTEEEKLEVLRRTMISSFDMTMKQLIADGAPIDRDTVEARNYFVANSVKK